MMVLTYRFKKEKLENGRYAVRPRILVVLKGKNSSIEIPALIDSGCDTTVIPEGIAKATGIDMEGEKGKLFAFRESSEVISSKANFTFLGKLPRDSVNVDHIPVLITLSKKRVEEEGEIVLGVEGVFDIFDITFKKSQNKIILKKSSKVKGHFS
ncbi:MAG: hypothetical protein KAT77_02860 [Nanoarchaeota archaeon]|nr:hypothetical protein [Nanoarchaeota archaeon]